MIRLTVSIITLLLLALIVPVVGTAAYRAVYHQASPSTQQNAPVNEATPNNDSAATIPKMDLPAIAAYSEAITRPLFFEGRTYPARVVPEQPLQPKPPIKQIYGVDGLKLLGIVAGSAPSRALVEVPPKSAAWFASGDKVQDWVVESIGQNSVRLSRDGQSATLLLYGFSMVD